VIDESNDDIAHLQQRPYHLLPALGEASRRDLYQCSPASRIAA
jgi:hypothetical protein